MVKYTINSLNNKLTFIRAARIPSVRIRPVVTELNTNDNKIISTSNRVRCKTNTRHIVCYNCKSKIKIGNSYILVVYSKHKWFTINNSFVFRNIITFCNEKCMVAMNL